MDLGLPSADAVDAAWLTAALQRAGVAPDGARVTGLTARTIGTGQMGTSVRYELTWSRPDPELPASVVGKFPSHDERSRAAGAGGAYAKELGFYRDLQPTLAVPTPTPLYAAFDPDTAEFTLLMTDVREARAGDQLAGCDLELAGRAADVIAHLHAGTWNRGEEIVALGWLPAPGPARLAEMVELYRLLHQGFAADFAGRLTDTELAAGRWIGEHFADLATAHRLAPCAVHNDFRLDNLLIGDGGGTGAGPLTVVDWQTMGIGFGPTDLAYFVGTGVEPATVEAAGGIGAERALVERYGAALAALGIDTTADDLWLSYRLGAASGYVMTVIASQLVIRTERGDAMFDAMARRSAAMMRRLALTDLVG